MRIANFSLVLACLCAIGVAESRLDAADSAPAWPQANGPHGNFNPRQYGHQLVDDLAQARKVWVSEQADLGFAKGSSSGYLKHLTEADTHPGAASGLIVAEGKVFASSFRTGQVWAEKLPHFQNGQAPALLADAAKMEVFRRNAAIDADDVTVAIDLATGKTVWKAVEAGKGVNRYSGKRNHFGVTPAYHDGRIFSLGTAGRLYCYDAATGEKRWEVEGGPLAAVSADLKQKLLREKNGFAPGGGMSASLVVAEGVLIVPQFDGSGRDVALRGVEASSGKTLWEVPAATCRYATPAVWTHAGRQYVLAATVGQAAKSDGGSLRLIDPAGGKVLWTVTGLAPTWYPLAASEKHVLVNVPSKVASPKKDGQPWGLMAAYRLSPAKADLAWTMPDQPSFWFENHFDICCMRRVLLRDGKVYFYGQGHTLDPAKSSFSFCILEEESGKPLYVSPVGEFGHHPSAGIIGQAWLVEDRLLNIRDSAHSDRAEIDLISVDPKNVRRLCSPWKPPHDNTTAYEVFIELPYVDGLFLMRNREGQVVCYDLRKVSEKSGR